VIEGAVTGSFQLTLAKRDGTPDLTNHHIVRISDFERDWIGHPDPTVDLAIFPCAHLFQRLTEEGKHIVWTYLDQNLIPNEEGAQALTPLEDLLIVGYPTGIWDKANNAPVFRRGITATFPYLDFNGKAEFLVDAAIFPGSSGSPVLLFNSGTWTSRSAGVQLGTRVQLLGIIYAVALYTATGEIEIQCQLCKFQII
jgi:hypothetical protein